MANKQKTLMAPPKNKVPQIDDDDDEMNLSEDEEGGTRVGGIYIPPPIKPYCSQESKGPRLVIWSIDNTMFKSYANTVTVGPFHHRFSAVIGPNGSGKSNVIDSMLFVFGYKAQKIRSKKLSVLIHNSSKYENVASCRVAVHFKQIKDNPDETYEIIPDSDIVVARTAYRDNKSFYTINNKEVNFKEVAILLQHHGIDLMHNRFLILQGEVESIAMMKPKAGTPNECGLLEYLEDIVGTTRYKKPLLLINDRLDRLNEERSEKHNRCRLAEREMKDLEQPMTEAVEYLKLENKLCTTNNLHMQVYIFVKKRELVGLCEKKDKATEKLTQHDEKYVNLKKEREEKEKFIQEEIQKHEALLSKREEFKSMQAKAKDGHTRVQAKMKATNNRRKELKKQQEVDKKSLEDLQTLPDRNNKEIAESEKQIGKMTKEKDDLENVLTKNLAKLEVDTKPLREEKEPLEKDLGVIRANLDELKANYSVTEKELDIIRMDETTEVRKFESLKNSFEDTKRDYKEKSENLEELKLSIPVIKQELVVKQEEIKVLQTEETAAAAELSKIRAKINDSTYKMQMAKSNNRVLNVLMNQKQTGKIPGILGRLGDLGGIDPKYDVAISTCCGRLENIVVEDVNTAQTCINFLKTNGLGHATFIALDKMDRYKHNANQKINTPENVPRLYDLIHVEDERVRPALYFALFDTLVATDLEQANRIAYGAKRFRVVSLNGDLIEMTGTMSGGGRQQKRGGMGKKVQTQSAPSRPSVSEVDLEAFNITCEKIQLSINDLQHRQGMLEEEIKVLTKTLQQKEYDLKRLYQTVKSYAEQLPRIQDQLKKQEQKANSTKSDSVKVVALEKKVKDCKFEFENKQAEVDVIQDKVDVLNKRIKEISDKNIKELRVKIDKLSKQIEKLTKNISTLTVEIRTTDRNMQKAKERIANSTTEIEEAETNLRLMDTERTQFSTDEQELEKRVEEVSEEIKNATSDSSSTKKEILAIQKQENEGKITRLELDENVKAMEKNFKEETAKIPHWERKLKALKLQPIPNEQMPDPPFKTYTDEELETRNPNELQYEITKLEEKLSVSKPNLSVIDDYNKKREAYLARVKILEEVTLKRNEMGEAFDGVRKKRYTEFTEGFQIISRKLKEMYQMITLGGDAELELVDSMDPFSEGIVFSVRPPKKSWKHISNLSGGEKTLSSLALVFALHYYKPSPLYFMDEIDAALDFKNVSIVANYINERTKNAQFIIISLRSNMFELADHLAGIYKVDDCSHSMTIKNLDKKNFGSYEENQSILIDDEAGEISPEKSMLDNTSADPFDQVLNSSTQERPMEVDTEPAKDKVAEEQSMDIDSIPDEDEPAEKDEAVEEDESLVDSDVSLEQEMEISGAFIPETPNFTGSFTMSPK